jgi:hypothetical protein
VTELLAEAVLHVVRSTCHTQGDSRKRCLSSQF